MEEKPVIKNKMMNRLRRLNILNIRNIVENSNPDEVMRWDTGINYIFREGFTKDYSLSRDFSTIQKCFHHFDATKFEYKKDDTTRLVQKKAFRIGDIFKKFTKVKKNDEPEEEQLLIPKCLDSVIVVKTQNGTGSGFVISKKGYIVTNYHVIGDDKSVSIVS